MALFKRVVGVSASFGRRWVQTGIPAESAKVAVKETSEDVLSLENLQTGNVKVKQDEKSGVAMLIMGRKPINSLNLDFLAEINMAIDKLHADKNCRGLVITSEMPKIFTAGLDITEMYQPKGNRLHAFWTMMQDLWIKLYGSRLVTISAINGSSPAAGCLISMCCDLRIMAQGPYAIGLNETNLGMVAPFWFQDTMINTIGQRETERALMLGRMFPGEEALKIGLVDALVPAEQMESKVQEEMAKWLRIPDGARVLTKQNLRQATINKLIKKKNEDLEYYVKFVTTKTAQNIMGKYLESLRNKAKKQ